MTSLVLQQVTIRYGCGSQAMVAVDGVDLHAASGKTLGLVGESGCGKSTLARAMVGLVPLSAGRILLDGRDLCEARRLNRCSPVQLVFQNPNASLNPRMSVAASIAEAMTCRDRVERDKAVEAQLDLVGLSASIGTRRPAELSGGQRQRVAIARTLAAQPKIIVADEITSALDVSVQAAILNLMMRLQRALGFTLIFISHNLAAVRYLSDEIAVMQRGRIIETGETEVLTRAPRHNYTRTLLQAAPTLRSPRPTTESDAATESP